MLSPIPSKLCGFKNMYFVFYDSNEIKNNCLILSNLVINQSNALVNYFSSSVTDSCECKTWKQSSMDEMSFYYRYNLLFVLSLC